MTTVAYRSGVLAADSSCWEGDTHAHAVRKVWRVRGCLVGCAGRLADINAFVRWMRDGADEDEYPRMKSLSAIVIGQDFRVRCFEDVGAQPIFVRDPYCAVGSGAPVALGAFHHGATAVEAVRAARHHNDGTKGRIITIRF